jgi:hypothetical protein
MANRVALQLAILAVMPVAQSSFAQPAEPPGILASTPASSTLSLRYSEMMAATPTGAQDAGQALPGDQKKARDGWEFEFAPYVWGASLRSHVDVGPVSTTADACFTDLLKDLEMAAMFRFEGRRNPWGFYLETLYLSLEDDTRKFGMDVDLDFTQLDVDFGGMYRFGGDWPHFDLMLGGRYTHLGTDISIGPTDLDGTDDFVSPVVGGRFQTLLHEKWVLSIKADFAGFGVGEAPDLTWGATSIIGYRLSERTTLGFGYRYYDVRVSDDLDVVYHGPMVGVAWQF